MKTAKQYLDRHSAHIEFTNWFIKELENRKNPPKSYLNDWRLFQSWLADPKLNIQIKCLVNFAEHFYEPLMQFMVGQDTIPRIYQDEQLIALPPGRRAHEMPDKIFEWHGFLQNLTTDFDMFFSDQLLEAVDLLSNEEFETLFDNLEHGITSALESFQKWFSQWLHLPLATCQLGGNNAQSFASSFYHVILEKPWISPPSDLELRFAQDLEDDKKNGITNDFGLNVLLHQNGIFLEEFTQFCICNDPKLYLFPNLYNFVKSKIYYIVIHQQQVEGLFNKLDLKTHASMTLSMKQSKLRLSSDKISKENLDNKLKEMRKQRNEARRTLQEIQPQQLFGPDIASKLFQQML